MTTPQDRYVTIGAIKTRYWSEGPDRSPVVLLHGLAAYAERYRLCFEALAAEHRVYILDLPGHGHTDKSPAIACKVEDLARFVSEFMAALEIRRAHIVG